MILTEDFHSKQQNIPKWRPRALPTCFPLPPEERFAALSCSKAAGKGLELGFQVPGGDRNPAVKCLRAAQVSPGRLYLCLDEFLRGISRLGWAGLAPSASLELQPGTATVPGTHRGTSGRTNSPSLPAVIKLLLPCRAERG